MNNIDILNEIERTVNRLENEIYDMESSIVLKKAEINDLLLDKRQLQTEGINIGDVLKFITEDGLEIKVVISSKYGGDRCDLILLEDYSDEYETWVKYSQIGYNAIYESTLINSFCTEYNLKFMGLWE